MTLSRLISSLRFRFELERNLRARKRLRPQRRAAALKGWTTRRAKA